MPTPISPELSLALGITSSPGVYALLLGSGVSTGAGIPTGWEVVLDLVRRLAVAEGKGAPRDPVHWYTTTYGSTPDYSALLEELGPQAGDRRSLLQGYFEATPEERAQGIKTPTAAHRAIASLEAEGYVRVIVTTNFDRLIESALEDAGITPVTIATTDDAASAGPLQHNRCTVIKVHGDYLDTRIRNSETELASYDPPIDALLDRVFDDYGLMVCGWSGEYDVALEAAIMRSESRRYTTYWCLHGAMSPVAGSLISHSQAQVLHIEEADSFFPRLVERVTTISQSDEEQSLEPQVAVDTLKRYLPDDQHRIRLRELVREATEELASHLRGEEFPPSTQFTDEELIARTQRLEALSETSLAVTANGSYWGEAQHDAVWLGTVRRLAEVDAPQAGLVVWLGLFRYPALLHLYAAGVGAVAADRYDWLARLLVGRCRSIDGRENSTIVQVVYPHNIVEERSAHALFPHPNAPQQNYKTPLSQYLHKLLRPVFADLIPDEREYTDVFDRFEYLASLVHADLHLRRSSWPIFAGGCFTWRNRLSAVIDEEVEQAGTAWAPLQAGLFDGSVDHFREVKGSVDKAISDYGRW